MQTQPSRQPIRISQPIPASSAVRSRPEWKPEPRELTREQVRAIIIEQLG